MIKQEEQDFMTSVGGVLRDAKRQTRLPEYELVRILLEPEALNGPGVSLLPGRMILHPENVLVIWTGDVELELGSQAGRSARVPPPMDL